MTALWSALLVAAAACYALKLAGVALPTAILEHPRVQRVAALLPIGMLAALVVVELFDGGGSYRWDWTVIAGVTAGGVALLARQGVLVVFLVAVASTAVLRLLL